MSTPLAVPSVERVTDTCFNHDGTLLAFLYIDGSVRIFEADENRAFTQVAETQPCCRRATSISFAASDLGAIFVVAEENGRTFLYERIRTNEFALAVTINQHKAPINSVAFAPSGLNYACGSSDGFISLTTCDMKHWSWQITKCSDKAVSSVSWSPQACMSFIEKPNGSDAARLVAGSADGFFTVFGIRSNVFMAETQPVVAHEGAVNCVAWRPLAGFARWEIATCGADNFVKLWTLETGAREWKNVVICKCDEEPVAVKWSQCGFMLSISEGLSTVRTWREKSDGTWTQMQDM